MSCYIRKSSSVDVMILGEGTYPYIRGGVSSWIHQIVTGMPEIKFGIVFLGSRASDYGDILYELPENIAHLEVHYMFGNEETGQVKKYKSNPKSIEKVKALHKWFKDPDGPLPEKIKNISFYTDEVPHEYFLHSRDSWDYITERYMANCPNISFVDYFWTLRNMHKPIWKLADIAKNLPVCKVLHSPSTGYAGFLGALSAYHIGTPFILTEHGIYTRERKIDMLTADWTDFRKPALLKQPEEVNYLKQMWVAFFERIGQFCYSKADPVLSLFHGARDIQIQFGAKKERTRVIPNGVDVDGLREVYLQRSADIPPVITLIGRVVSIKDIKTFIQAMRIVANTMPDVEGWIVGPNDEDENYALECKHMVETLDLVDNVKFLGFQNIENILPKTGLLTLTSISEGMPLVILEGFAAGIPCVSTDVGSCKELIYGAYDEEDIALGEAGAVTSIATPGALAESYIRFLGDEVLWKKAQKTALARVERYYRQDLFIATYKKIYMKAMEDGGNRV